MDPKNPTFRDGPVYDPATVHKYITTSSGKNVPRPDLFRWQDVRITDIIPALAKLCRYNGHVDRFYSVAEHSVLVSLFAELRGDKEAIVPGLYHDAHEAYMGDIASPHKAMIGPSFWQFEIDFERPVREYLGLKDVPTEVWKRVREYDILILHRELRNLREILPDWYDPHQERMVPALIQPMGLEWREAEQLFWDRRRELLEDSSTLA